MAPVPSWQIGCSAGRTPAPEGPTAGVGEALAAPSGILKMRQSILKRRRRSSIAEGEMPRMAVGVQARPVAPDWVVGLSEMHA
eukprot:13146883-Heterocapsa_arctica.AAC.1